MTTRASGTFDVKLTPQPLYDGAADATLGRMSIDKQFYGDPEATSKGMLSALTEVKGSAGYVAIETLAGMSKERDQNNNRDRHSDHIKQH